MAKAKKSKSEDVQAPAEAAGTPNPAARRPRLHKLSVSNFRCIGSKPVEIELDDIVVLVGPNNAGKSSILRAYELVMRDGSGGAQLSADDFPNGAPDPSNPPTIELETVVYDKTAPGEQWVRTDALTGEMYVREKWTWSAPGDPRRVGWDVAAQGWHADQKPWGFANVANANRPTPHSIGPFKKPEEQAAEVVKLLSKAITDRTKDLRKKKTGAAGDQPPTDYDKLLTSMKELRRSIATDAKTAVVDVEQDLGRMIADVFPGYVVAFDARPDEDVEESLALYKPAPVLRMGLGGGFLSTLDAQGSGACRTMLWATLRLLAERSPSKDDAASERPNVLLMDEPELCLHPDAIREARRVLYDLPQTQNWQVMITTHSPVFIDLSRNNTSIVRVERGTTGAVEGTTIYRPTRAHLDDDDKAELKLLNMCDPYVAEFFFGGRTIVVEGDTEYTAFNHVISRDPEKYKGLHIVRARGKACVVSLAKILNQFDKGYAILHDSDTQFVVAKKTKKRRANSAWTENGKILAATADGRAKGRVRLLASVPNFERAFFEEEAKEEKPYTALLRMRADEAAFGRIVALLDALRDSSAPVPTGAVEWKTIEDLSALVEGCEPSDKAEPVNA
ncbi:MAG: AAA family ATPase [Planctomycetes bacterium]|nr:AAA family ATPase [Planctomycetota bacterium]